MHVSNLFDLNQGRAEIQLIQKNDDVVPKLVTHIDDGIYGGWDASTIHELASKELRDSQARDSTWKAHLLLC